jgi:hypothetical protein
MTVSRHRAAPGTLGDLTHPPDEIRELQNRWDAVITARTGLQTLALAGLLTALTAGR